MLRRNPHPRGERLRMRAGGWPRCFYPVDSAFNDRHSALPRLRPARNGPQALCPVPFRVVSASGCAVEPSAAPESICSSCRKRLIAWNRAGQAACGVWRSRIVLAKPSRPSDPPEWGCSRRLDLLMSWKGAAQDIVDFWGDRMAPFKPDPRHTGGVCRDPSVSFRRILKDNRMPDRPRR